MLFETDCVERRTPCVLECVDVFSWAWSQTTLHILTQKSASSPSSHVESGTLSVRLEYSGDNEGAVLGIGP